MRDLLKKLVFLTPLITGCGCTTTEVAQEPIALNTSENIASTRLLNLNLNQTAVVKLIEAQGTGYKWEYASQSSALSVTETTPSQQPNELTGGTIERSWVIRSLNAGTYSITFQYARPWEPQPLKKIDYTLTFK